MYKVIVNGAFGKMGVIACQAIEADSKLQCIAKLGKEHDLAATIQDLQPHIVLDLTNAHVVRRNAETIILNNTVPVIGTSGLTNNDITELKSLALKQGIGGMIIPNFAIGAVLMMQFVQQASRYFDDVAIIERHHKAKLDSPSGTALATADLIRKNDNKDKNISIHSLRMAGACAHQTVILSTENEKLEIKQDVNNRNSFKKGIIYACHNALNLSKLVVGLENILI